MSENILIAQIFIGAARLGIKFVEIFGGNHPALKKRNAARKIYLAISATDDYLDNHDLKKKRDRQREKRLDKLWQEAARAIEPLDFALSERLYYKADYWRNPIRWKSKQIKEAQITLKEVRVAALQFL